MSTPSPDWLLQLRAQAGAPAAPARLAKDPVNLPTIRRWCAAMGERNPAYLDETSAAARANGGIIAPPAMLEVWTMRGFHNDGSTEHGSLLGIGQMDEAGFRSVVATNLAQEYVRELRLGDLITQHVTFAGVSEQKKTALGTGHFLDYTYEFTDQGGAVVGRMRFRILKYRPAPQQTVAPAAPATAGKPPHPRPAITRDSAFFWEGLNARRLLIRKCTRCQHLHHPPGPMCPVCHSQEWTAVESSGRGTIHSFVIVHQGQLPGFTYPLPVAVIDLEEGTRVVSNLSGIGVDEVRIGMPVEIEFNEVEPGYVLYAFHPRPGG
jgi:uncharacterized OB-fold protein